jgi:predicted MFS family arabinose efflux permease
MVMMPLGPQIMRAFHITPAAFATAVSAYSWCAGLSGLFAATYIDRFNRRSLLLVMYGLFAVSNLACAFAHTFELLLIARAFAGLTGGVIGSVILAIVGDVVPGNRRGAAMGIIMSAFSLAAVLGVPLGIALGAHFGWGTPFFMLFALSFLIAAAGGFMVPSLGQHLAREQRRIAAIVPQLWILITTPAHGRAFLLTFAMMVSQMMVIPFISPVLVANHGVSPTELSWMYVAGGMAPFFVSRFIGRMADRYGYRQVFRFMVLFSLGPILLLTHLPNLSFIAIVAIFPIFTIAMTGRMVPLQALLTTVPKAVDRGAFLSINSSFQSLGSGCGAWFGGLLLSDLPDGSITGYGANGLLAAALALFVVLWVSRVRGAAESSVTREPAPGKGVPI